MDWTAVCSSEGCGVLLGALGLYDPEGGHRCGACQVYAKHECLLCEHAAQFNLLASGRSTSRLLSLVRGQSLLRVLADMSVGTLESAMRNFKVRLLDANMRMILLGRPYGFRPVFSRLDRAWLHDTEEDCLDLVMDFLSPWPRPALDELRV